MRITNTSRSSMLTPGLRQGGPILSTVLVIHIVKCFHNLFQLICEAPSPCPHLPLPDVVLLHPLSVPLLLRVYPLLLLLHRVERAASSHHVQLLLIQLGTDKLSYTLHLPT